MDRMYRLKEGDTPASLAREGKGDPVELQKANKTWLDSTFYPWNPGQRMVVPMSWASLKGEYPSES